jgi:D-alanyl-D-alanine carboxypeptidase
MTAFVAAKYLPLDKEIRISKNTGVLKKGDTLKAKDLLNMALIESSNESVEAIARDFGEKTFLDYMNQEAQSLNLRNTLFINPIGLDPINSTSTPNYSTAKDLLELARVIIKNHPAILGITTKAKYDIYTAQGSLHHTAQNTNELLRDANWPMRILGGKTGETPRANKNLVLVLEAPNQSGYLINIILGSNDHFGEMKKLVDWVSQAYDW